MVWGCARPLAKLAAGSRSEKRSAMRYGLEFTHCPLPTGVDREDLPWTAVRGVEFTSDAEALDHADEATADSDGALVFRVVELDAEQPLPGLAKTKPADARLDSRAIALRAIEAPRFRVIVSTP